MNSDGHDFEGWVVVFGGLVFGLAVPSPHVHPWVPAFAGMTYEDAFNCAISGLSRGAEPRLYLP